MEIPTNQYLLEEDFPPLQPTSSPKSMAQYSHHPTNPTVVINTITTNPYDENQKTHDTNKPHSADSNDKLNSDTETTTLAQGL